MSEGGFEMAKLRGGAMVGAWILLMFAVAVAAAGCGSSATSGAGGEVKVEAKDQGRQIDVQQGQALVVTLESNPSTGYTWEQAEAGDQVLDSLGKPEFSSQSNKLGAPGMQTLRFRASRSGQTTLKLVYHRSWEEGIEPLQIFTIQVHVK
jgi:inhibitor of cysteine peptidase